MEKVEAFMRSRCLWVVAVVSVVERAVEVGEQGCAAGEGRAQVIAPAP